MANLVSFGLIIVHHLILIIKNDFLVWGKGPTDDINGSINSNSIGAVKKNNSINFSKAKTTFYLILHYNGDSNYFFVDRKKIICSKQIIKSRHFKSVLS